MSILIFFLVLFVLILVHEWGHFIVAKKTHMRVDEFGIGFPPKLFGIKKGETEYTFNALPIGGFVRIFGENAEDSAVDATEGKDISGSFSSKSKWAQAAVLIAGVTMNVIFAWFLFAIVFMVGLPTAVSEDVATDDAVLTITHVVANGPAAFAELPIGAQITSLAAGEESVEVLTPTSFKEFSESHGDAALSVGYTYRDEAFVVEVTPTEGLIIDEPNRPAIGVALALVEVVKQPFVTAVVEAVKMTGNSLVAITQGLTSLIVNSVRGTADFSAVAGPIGIVGLVGDAAQFGFTSLLMFTAVISLNLAVVNLLPFPALDGGRLVFVGLEAIMRRPINPVWVARLNLTGFALLMLLMVAVTYNDLLKMF